MEDIETIINDIYENSKSHDYIMIHSDITELLYNNNYEIVKDKFYFI